VSGARCRQLYDLHINSMTDTLFFFQIISFKKYFYVSLGNFFTVFVESPQLWRPLGNCQFAPLLKSGPAVWGSLHTLYSVCVSV